MTDKSRTLIFLFDGTRNGLDDEFPTNIRLMKHLLDVPNQEVFYFEGPGNDESKWIDSFFGSVFGVGCIRIRDEALEVFKKEYVFGDKIIGIGFSRGGAENRMFCFELGKMGYEVDFMGCFDTVFARTPFGWFQQRTLFGDLHVHPKVKVARHAVAIDEDRGAFTPNLMNARDGVKEVWFTGNHADIGGGYEDRGLADITLKWMLSEGATHAGLTHLNPLPHHTPKPPHREAMPPMRQKRHIGVKVDGEWSGIPHKVFVQ